MKKILILLLLITPFIGFGQDSQFNEDINVYKVYHKNGQIKMDGFSNGSNKIGLMKEYYENGELKETGVYKLPEDSKEDRWKPSLKVGVWKKYYYKGNGQLLSTGSYKNGEKTGVWKKYHENGQLLSTGSYKNGEMIDVWKVFYKKNGQLKEELTIVSNNKSTPNTFPWSGNGWNFPVKNDETHVEVLYLNNYKKYFTNGNLKREIDEGKVTEYYGTGQTQSETTFKNGQRNKLKIYYENGQLFSEGEYKNDKKEGLWKEYHLNGKLSVKKEFKNNDIVSVNCWDKDGNKIECEE